MSDPVKEKEKQKLDLGLLEDGDDFEEFPAESILICYFIYPNTTKKIL